MKPGHSYTQITYRFMQESRFNPFRFYTRQLEIKLNKAGNSRDPAWYLYRNGARTQLFMLEALTKLYLKDTDDQSIAKWFRRFKKLEDSLGVIDYYDVFIQDFKKNKKISKAVIAWCEKKRDKEADHLNRLLKQKKWRDSKLSKFEFACLDIVYDQTHLDFLKQVMTEYTFHIRDFVKETGCHFTELDSHVHELRRKLRWLSMYAMALHGLVQLKNPRKRYPWEKEYITKAVLANPYNKVVAAPKGITPIYYDASVFYAISKMITDIAFYKDQGLKLELLTKALRKTERVNEADAHQQAMKLLGKSQFTVEQVLGKVSALAKHFFIDKKVLDHALVLP